MLVLSAPACQTARYADIVINRRLDHGTRAVSTRTCPPLLFPREKLKKGYVPTFLTGIPRVHFEFCILDFEFTLGFRV